MSRRLIACVLLALLVSVCCSSAQLVEIEKALKAKEDAAGAGFTPPTRTEVEKSLADVERRVANLQGEPAQESLDRVAVLLRQQLSELATVGDIQTNLTSLRGRVENWKKPDEAFFPIRRLDELKRQRRAREIELSVYQRLRDGYLNAEKQFADEVPEASRTVGQLTEQVEAAATKESAADFQNQLDLAQANLQLIHERRVLLQLRAHAIGLRCEDSEFNLDLVNKDIGVVSKKVEFKQAEYDAIVKDIGAQAAKVETELRAVEGKISGLRKPANGAAAPADADMASEIEMLRADMLRGLRGALEVETLLWKLRFGHWSRKDKLPEDQVMSQMGELTERAGVMKELVRLRRESLALLSSGVNVSPLQAVLISAQQQLLEWFDGRLMSLDVLLQEVKAELGAAEAAATAEQRLEKITGRTKRLFQSVWNFEITSVEDKFVINGKEVVGRRGITVGKVVIALSIIVATFLFARWLGNRLRRWSSRRLHASDRVSTAVYRVALWGLTIFGLIAALGYVRIPLTLFTFLGGALAVGVGFGAQNIINNFISGIILAFERPIKVGDVVEVDKMRGRIISVGTRASVIRRGDGVELLVPNKEFLEKVVTNLTHTDNLLRYEVSVGVAHGTSIKRVRDIMTRVGDSHGQVLKTPSPVVLFEDYGASLLMFTLCFWVELSRDLDGRRVCSDIRFMLADAFAEAGISPSSPAKELHLDSTSELKVEIVKAHGKKEDDPPAPSGPAPGSKPLPPVR